MGFLCLAMMLTLGSVRAQPVDNALPTFQHSRWTSDDGAPSEIAHIAQTPDGFLWLATADGLFRFDGAKFERVPDKSMRAGKGYQPTALFVSKSGELWIGYSGGGGVSVLRAGHMVDTTMPEPPTMIIKLFQDAAGDIWAIWGGKAGRLWRYHHAKWQLMDDSVALPPGFILDGLASKQAGLVIGMISPDQMSGQVVSLPDGASRFRSNPVRADYPSLAQDRLGNLWLADRLGTRRLYRQPDGGLAERGPSYPAQPNLRVPTTIVDRHGDIWSATKSNGIFHIAAPTSPRVGVPRVDHFDALQGLTDDFSMSVFEDREGNIWFGTVRGLDRFAPAKAVTELAVPPDPTDGMQIASSPDGAVFVLSNDAIYEIEPGKAPSRRLATGADTKAICFGREGLWVVSFRRLSLLAPGSFRDIDTPPLGEWHPDACFEDRQGRLWVSEETGLLWRDAQGWHKVDPSKIGTETATEIAEDGDGTMIFNLAGKSLLLRNESGLKIVNPEKAGLGYVFGVSSGRAHALIMGSGGIARLQNGQLQILSPAIYPWAGNIRNSIQTAAGETWLNTPRVVLRLKTADLMRAFDHPGAAIKVSEYDRRDGVPSSRQHVGFRGQQFGEGADGRIWLLTRSGLIKFDPARIPVNRIPPGVKITRLAAEGVDIADPTRVTLPTGTTNLYISFAALSLSRPERVQFRYRLDGIDKQWIDSHGKRDASYGNLRPGTYRFHVIAANEDGVWNRTGDVLEFKVPPTFVQTWLFLILCAVAVLALLWLLYFLRVRQLASRMRENMEERLAERQRIADNLHDNLLQNIQGLIMRLHAISMRPGLDDGAKAAMAVAMDKAEDTLVEGRQHVADLHAEPQQTPGDYLKEFIQRLDRPQDLDLSVETVGVQRPLHPAVGEAAIKIAREAILNGYKHAAAQRISVRIFYDPDRFQVSVKDDGRGIDSEILARGGRDRHFGLPGMRDRARRAGGELDLQSEPGAGTTVTFDVVGRAAFRSERGRSTWKRIVDRLS